MECATFRVHQGPSIYSPRPVIRYQLEVADDLQRDLKPVTDQLAGLIPGMGDRHALCMSALEQQNEERWGASIAHLFEHFSIELQNLTGAQLACVRAGRAPISAGDAVIPFDDDEVGLASGTLALDVIGTLSSGRPFLDWAHRLKAFVRLAERERLPAQDRALVRAAEARDIPVTRIAGRLIQLGHGRNQQRLSGTKTTHTSIVSNDIAANKDYARRVFQAFGLPIPRYERVHREEDAVSAAMRIGFPVVVKPNQSKMGGGVSVGMKSPQEVRDAFEKTRRVGTSTLVEEYVDGSDYRLLVINGKLEAAARRVPAHVVGDGTHTIAELVRRANQDPRRGEGHHSAWTRLEFVPESDRLLAERGYRRDSIAREGEVVPLRRVANTSAGGTAIDVTAQVHPENREIAERAAVAIGLDIAGVDLLVRDITQPMRAQGGVICEINSRPGLRKHLWPAEGQPHDVLGPIMDMLFPPGSRSRIPIVVVTGSGDARTVACILAHLLAAEGTSVGLATRQGLFINGIPMAVAGVGPGAARMLLLDPTVDLVILEVTPGDASAHGLGYDWADACAVINDQRIDSPELVEALRLIVRTARVQVVMSAEDEIAYRLKAHPDARVSHGSVNGPAPAEAIAMSLALALGRPQAEMERRLVSLSQPHAR